MTTWQIILLVCVFLFMDAIIIGAVFHFVGAAARELAKRFPPVEPAPGAITKRFQSIRIGTMNFGGCVHITRDDHHLHLRPARLARWAGLRDLSIPWPSIRIDAQALAKKGRTVSVKIDRDDMLLPRWCVEATPSEPEA